MLLRFLIYKVPFRLCCLNIQTMYTFQPTNVYLKLTWQILHKVSIVLYIVKHVCYYLTRHVFSTKCEHSSKIHDAPAFKSMCERNLRNRAPGAGNQAPLTEQKIIKPESQTWFQSQHRTIQTTDIEYHGTWEEKKEGDNCGKEEKSTNDTCQRETSSSFMCSVIIARYLSMSLCNSAFKKRFQISSFIDKWPYSVSLFTLEWAGERVGH